MSDKKDRVLFTVDGREFQAPDKHQTAASILQIAGLDPALYDLARVKPGAGGEHTLRDTQPVTIKDGEKFVSVRQSAPVA
jgi:hypothetical protein